LRRGPRGVKFIYRVSNVNDCKNQRVYNVPLHQGPSEQALQLNKKLEGRHYLDGIFLPLRKGFIEITIKLLKRGLVCSLNAIFQRVRNLSQQFRILHPHELSLRQNSRITQIRLERSSKMVDVPFELALERRMS